MILSPKKHKNQSESVFSSFWALYLYVLIREIDLESWGDFIRKLRMGKYGGKFPGGHLHIPSFLSWKKFKFSNNCKFGNVSVTSSTVNKEDNAFVETLVKLRNKKRRVHMQILGYGVGPMADIRSNAAAGFSWFYYRILCSMAL